MLEVKKIIGHENIDNLPAELFITVYCDEHWDLLLHAELGWDGELPGDDGVREHLEYGDEPDRVMASGEPVGYKNDQYLGRLPGVAGHSTHRGAGHPHGDHYAVLHIISHPHSR